MKLRFEKWEGLGNDFILVERDALPRDLSDGEVRALCDRKRGIGADGVLLIGEKDGASMIVRNADGSRPEMCGNGIRCVAGYLLRAPSGGASIAIRTDAGDRGCHVDVVRDGEVEVEVAMGPARFDGPLEASIADVSGDARKHRFELASMGNPHAITFEAYDSAEIDRIAPIVETSRPGGTNVEFVRREGAVLVVRVWERGVGYTDACGTGACAALAVACKAGICSFGEDVTVRLPGGDLVIRIAAETYEVSMRGPAKRAFRGETELWVDSPKRALRKRQVPS